MSAQMFYEWTHIKITYLNKYLSGDQLEKDLGNISNKF